VLIRTVVVVNIEYIKLHPANVFCTVNDIQRLTKASFTVTATTAPK
jgi:hypothetical protein